MIVAVTLNASIDKAYHLEVPLVPGHVMRIASSDDSAGGKGINVARSVDACGEQVVACGLLGGHNGAYLTTLLDADHIAHDFVKCAAETRCCVNVLEPDGRSTEFLEPGRKVSSLEVVSVMAKVADLAARAEVVTLSGSLPQGCAERTYEDLVRLVHAAGARCVLDASGAALLHGLAAQPDVVKPNADELQDVFGHPLDTTDKIKDAAAELRRRGARCVVVSLGAKGALMASEEGVFVARAPRIEARNPVGAGDTMVGALAVALARRMPAADGLAFAVAAATASCLSDRTGRFESHLADQLLQEVTIEAL